MLIRTYRAPHFHHEIAAGVLLLASSFTTSAQTAPPDACTEQEAALKSSMTAIQEQFKEAVEKKKAEYAEKTAAIQKDADDAKPSTVGAIVKFDFKVDWKDETFIFDTPTATMKETKMILGLPQVSINQQKWIYDLPATRMENQKIGQHPEMTCDHAVIPGCTIEWKDNFASVPVFYMERHETILGVPEFAVRNQTIIVGVPEFTMQRQKFILGLPQVTLKNVTVETDKVQKEADDFQHEAEDDATKISSSMRAEIKTVGTQKIHEVFQCERKQLESKRGEALVQINAEVSTATANAQADRDAHADAQAKAADGVVQQLVATRAVISTQFDSAALQLNAAEKKAVESMSTGK